MTIVVSGVFEKYSRDEIKELIEANGGKNATSISKKTSFVVAGENMGPAKLAKCESLGVKIITIYPFNQRKLPTKEGVVIKKTKSYIPGIENDQIKTHQS